MVQRARDEFLAGTGCAGDQHTEPARGDAADRTEQLAHAGAVAYQVVLGWRRQRRRCDERGRLHQRTASDGNRVVQVERFGQIVERAVAIRRRRCGHVGERTHDDDAHTGRLGPDAFKQVQSVRAGHAHVAEQHGRDIVSERGQRAFGLAKLADRKAGVAQGGGQHETHAAIVIDNPDLCGLSHACLRPAATG